MNVLMASKDSTHAVPGLLLRKNNKQWTRYLGDRLQICQIEGSIIRYRVTQRTCFSEISPLILAWARGRGRE